MKESSSMDFGQQNSSFWFLQYKQRGGLLIYCNLLRHLHTLGNMVRLNENNLGKCVAKELKAHRNYTTMVYLHMLHVTQISLMSPTNNLN